MMVKLCLSNISSMGISFLTLNDVDKFLNDLSAQDKEILLAKQFANLPPESKSKVFGGSFISLNSDIAIIQTSSGFDPETVFKALADYHKVDREEKSG